MSIYEVKKIQIVPILKVFPAVFVIFGAFNGFLALSFIFSFVLPTLPPGLITDISFGAKFSALLMFVIIYTVVLTLAMLVFVWLYNFVSSKIGSGITMSLEDKDK
ncbi:MAG: hypothetical protein LBL71_03600 [Endomicrobium sp.]|jgi:hypothetical protein|nr:hypothetical protein [Endomicrobium sp.]